MNNPSAEQMAELRAKATPGDWFTYFSEKGFWTVQTLTGWMFVQSDKGTEHDAKFIAAASRYDFTAQSEAAKVLRERVQGLEARLRRCCVAVVDSTGDEAVDNNHIGEALARWQDADAFVNDQFCDMVCRACQAESQLATKVDETSELKKSVRVAFAKGFDAAGAGRTKGENPHEAGLLQEVWHAGYMLRNTRLECYALIGMVSEQASTLTAQADEIRRLREDRDYYRAQHNQLHAELKCPECGCRSITLTADTTWNCDGCKLRWPVNIARETLAASGEAK